MAKQYNNALMDFFRSERADSLEAQKLDILNKIANKPATTNTLIYIIPVIALVIFGVIFAVALKKKSA